MMRGITLLVGCLTVLAVVGVAAAATLTGDAPVAEGPAATGPAAVPPAAPVAPTPPPPAEVTAEPTYPFNGKVTADLVNIRCGPGLYYYPLTALDKDTPVVVESETNGWLALRAPDSIFGLMRTSDLEVEAGGTSATVTAPEARVYVSSATAKRQWCVGSILRKGDRVAVIGPDEGDFLRVSSPKDVRAYIVADYVTATTGAEAADGTAGVGDSAVVPEVGPPDVNPLIEAFNEADKALKREMIKPIGQRELDPCAALYQDILDKAEKDYVKKACQQRLDYIAGYQQQEEEYTRVQALSDRLDERLAAIKSQYAEKKADQSAEQAIVSQGFVAEGMVRQLEILEGVDYPIKYKLVDPNNKPLVVLKSSQYDLSKYVGKIIGVRGTKTYLKDWRIYCVTVDDLEVRE